VLARCDAVLRTDGESRGADMDVARARQLGIPVYHDAADLPSRASAMGEPGA
jgi:hypothetical protein